MDPQAFQVEAIAISLSHKIVTKVLFNLVPGFGCQVSGRTRGLRTENRWQQTKGRLLSSLSHLFADTRHLTPNIKPLKLS
jgi:hypothetical protein